MDTPPPTPSTEIDEVRMARARVGAVPATTPEVAAPLVGAAPDASVPFEAMRWRSATFGGVMVDTASIERRFVSSRLASLRAGVRGRGKVDLAEDGVLTVQFGLTDDEIADGMLDSYADQLLAYLNLEPGHVIDKRVATVPRDPGVDEEIGAGLRGLGLRALRDWT